MIFSKPVHFYLNTKYPWVTAANSKNSTGDFRRVALKIVVLFTLFSLKGEKLTAFCLFADCEIVFVKYGVDFPVITKM